jgi:DNA-binding NarL/FixJ family response regulator
MTIRILIADDQPLVCQGLQMYLSLDAELEIVGIAGNGYEAVRLAQELKPDVILMDLRMPQMDGIDATALLRANRIPTAIIALSQSQNPDEIDTVMKAGANIFLLKGVKTEELIMVIKRIATI